MTYWERCYSVASTASRPSLCGTLVLLMLGLSACGDEASSTRRIDDSTAVRSSELTSGPRLYRRTATLVASDPNPAGGQNDRYGALAAIEGETAIVTARRATRDVNGDGSEESGAGAAYVYEHTGGQWRETQILTPSDAEADQFFGTGVALDGDTAVIGAALDNRDVSGDSSEERAVGAAYVFVRSQGKWREQTKLTASDAAAVDEFGTDVDVSGDTALISAPSKFRDLDGDGTAEKAVGAAYVFTRAQGAWAEQTKLTASSPEEVGRFGDNVAVEADTAIVTMPRADRDVDGDGDAESRVGEAYVFGRSQGSWSEQTVLHASDGEADEWFGTDLALDGDTVLFGALRERRDLDGDGTEESDVGAVYEFVRSNGSWSEQQKFVSPAPAENAAFGLVGKQDDVAVVGAFRKGHSGMERAGAAYVFTRSEDGWNYRQTFAPSTLADGDRFGAPIAVAGDTALIGATERDRDVDGDGSKEEDVGAVFGYTADRDGDGISDSDDICPDQPNPDQIDTDGDSSGDACDRCPEDANKTEPGECGCGTEETDSDGDGTADCVDRCPMDEDKIEPGVCGCGAEETDQDNDGTPDCRDQCPSNPDKTHPGACGCSRSDEDSDGDGLPDCFDACPNEEGPSGGDGCPANPDTGLDSDDATGDTGTGRGDDRQGEDGNCSTVGDGSIPGRLPLFGVLAVAVALRHRD